VRRGLADPAGTYATNVSGTAHLLDAVRAEAPEAAVVVVTSDKCYAAPGARRCREDDPLGGRDPYSSSKAAQELVAAAYRDSLGLRIATARAGNVIGGGDWAEDRLVPDLVRAAFARRPLRLRDPDAVRPWQHVLNPLSGYLELARRLTGSAASARAFNFGPAAEDERPVRWVVERLAARWPGGVDVGLDARDSAAVEAHALRLDSSRAREALGWAPRWRLAEALEAVVEWHAEVALGADARAVTLAQLERFALPRSAASLQRR
jgi:CDP-glucose 4,6-dehydratase